MPERVASRARRSRIAIVAHGIHDDGGMERAFAELVRRVHSRYDLVVLSTDLSDSLRDKIQWRRIPAPGRPAALRFVVFYIIAGLRLAFTRADLVQSVGAIVPNRVDLASVHFCNAGCVEATGYAPRDTPAVRRLNTALARCVGLLAERWSYRPSRVACLAPVSASLAQEIERHYPGVRVAVAPNGINRSRFHPSADRREAVRRLFGFSESDVVVLFVGGDWYRKGLALAIDGIAAASAHASHPLRLLVVGHGDEQHFGRVASRAGVSESVVFAGRRSDTERFYAAADVFLLPSWYETFSLAAYEAAASGLPIVATAVHGVSELVGDGAAGFIVDRTVGAIADALARLAESPELRQTLGGGALARSADFTWDRAVDSTDSLYRALLSDRRALSGVPA